MCFRGGRETPSCVAGVPPSPWSDELGEKPAATWSATHKCLLLVVLELTHSFPPSVAQAPERRAVVKVTGADSSYGWIPCVNLSEMSLVTRSEFSPGGWRCLVCGHRFAQTTFKATRPTRGHTSPALFCTDIPPGFGSPLYVVPRVCNAHSLGCTAQCKQPVV